MLDNVSRMHVFVRDNAIYLIHSVTYVSKIEIHKQSRYIVSLLLIQQQIRYL